MPDIEPLEAKDCEKILEWNEDTSEDFLFQWSGTRTYTYPLTISQLEKRLLNEDICMFKILADGKMLGTFELRKLSEAGDEMLIGCFLISPDARGLGIGRKALEALTKRVFSDDAVRYLKLNVFAFNVPAIRCYENAGWRVEEYREAENPKLNALTMSIENIN